jgi:hypothetical protein
MQFGNKVFRTFNNVLTEEQQHTVAGFLSQRRWSFDNWAAHEADKGVLCWSLWGLEEDEFFHTTFKQRIVELTGINYTHTRIYANGQSFGQDGVFHIDANDSRAHTFLYYATPLDPLDVYEYGGETQFIQDNGELYHIYPFTNTAVLFDGRIWHRGMGPNKWTKHLRTSVAFKLYLP